MVERKSNIVNPHMIMHNRIGFAVDEAEETVLKEGQIELFLRRVFECFTGFAYWNSQYSSRHVTKAWSITITQRMFQDMLELKVKFGLNVFIKWNGKVKSRTNSIF